MRRCHDLGFRPAGIAELADLSSDSQRPCHERELLARAHLAEVEAWISDLDALAVELSQIVVMPRQYDDLQLPHHQDTGSKLNVQHVGSECCLPWPWRATSHDPLETAGSRSAGAWMPNANSAFPPPVVGSTALHEGAAG
ncbi:hypothetical protein CDV50_13195 [Haematobacter massiliensis]|uniref:MerR family DNA-binding protein n=1 Tax=Haematobacter massiliensis TaxID=195105 RepID=UPI000A018614|nr:hypothetical protein CDV50_13195 [Haematobacter massiliensis]OWJ87523.1 hypothetical protein CDV51_05920 [Haematobacter massiliensis]QBJ25376.1 hypothetical protein HmaOT1_11025 [Haematobacter massiliensis]